MSLKKANNKKEESKGVPLSIRVPKTDKYTESFEDTLQNIHAIAVLQLKLFGRSGYQIKLLEAILTELKTLNKVVGKE